MAEQVDIKSLSLQELRTLTEALGEKAYRADQMYEWMHRKMARSFADMTNLPERLREECSRHYRYTAVVPLKVQQSAADGTKKFLFAMEDGETVESVLMKYHHGNSVCISSQVGCRMGCRFCASTLDGCKRNLLPSEMLDQVYAISLLTGERVSNVVVMGTGEPLDDYDNLIRFLKLLTDENGLHISQRNVTVSTCGLVPEIRRLAGEKLQITLALSLHAATDEKRRQMMPVAKRYSIGELMEACAFYFQSTGRRITLEYCMVRGVNDTPEDAKRLASLAGSGGYHVNLIPMNPVRERNMRPSGGREVQEFKKSLEARGVNVTVRREMGRDIDGACGQLRHRHLEDKSKCENE